MFLANASANAKTAHVPRSCEYFTETANLARGTAYIGSALSGYKETNRIIEEYQLIRSDVVW
jgi:hypothetical protein